MYKVIRYFTDLQDSNHPYEVGDVFPRDGKMVSEERLSELSGSHNRQNKPLIRLVKESEQEVKYTKTEINRMNKADLTALATLMAIDGAENMNAVGLKEALIQHFGL